MKQNPNPPDVVNRNTNARYVVVTLIKSFKSDAQNDIFFRPNLRRFSARLESRAGFSHFQASEGGGTTLFQERELTLQVAYTKKVR